MHLLASCFAAAVLAFAAGTHAVHAHATCQPPVGIPQKTMAVGVRIPHGCSANDTTAVTIKIPANVTSAKPMLIPGWNVTIATRPLDTPIVEQSGATVNTTTAAVTWTALAQGLPDNMFMDFSINVRLPNGNDGDWVPFETVQYCQSNNESEYWNGTIVPKVILMRNGTLLQASDFGSNTVPGAAGNASATAGAKSSAVKAAGAVISGVTAAVLGAAVLVF